MEKPLLNFGVIALSALIPMILGFIWYNPKVFGKAWMAVSGMTEEKAKKGNMPLIFGLSYVLSVMIGMALSGIVIHQNGLFSLLNGDAEAAKATFEFLNERVPNWATSFRTFGHGALHGFIVALFVGIPVLATNSMFEQKGFKYVAVNGGYWLLTITLMGGVICQFS